MNIRKNEPFTIVIEKNGGTTFKAGAVEYQMPQKFADELLKVRKGEEKNMRPQDFLVQYVNNECGLMYNCVKVTLV